MKKYLLALSLVNVLAADTLLDTQVISDSGFSTSLSDVSSNIYVINKEDISKKNYKDVAEILSTLPGVSLNPVGFSSNISIRGNQPGLGSVRVKFLLDGIDQTSTDVSHLGVPYNTISVNDIEQIEVIPGGGSVIYGSGSAGGVINVITKASLKKDYANFMLGVGSFHHKSIGASAGANITDRIYTHFGINYIDEKGYQRADINKLLNTDLGFKFALTDRQSLELNANYMNHKDRESQALTEEQKNADRRQAGEACVEYSGHSCAKTGDFLSTNPQPLVSTRKSFDIKYKNEINDEIETNVMAYLRESNFKDKQLIDKLKGVNAKAKFAYGPSTTVVGYDFSHSYGERHQFGFNRAKKDAHSIYALEQISYDSFGIDFGARYEKTKLNIYRKSTTDDISTDQKYNNYGANLVLSYKFADTNTIFFKAERGFNSPSPYALNNKKTSTYEESGIKPEKYTTFELGFKGLVFEQFASFTIFHTSTKDEIVYGPKVGYFSYYENISKTRRYGAELFMQQSLFDDRLSLSESFSYINAKVLDEGLRPGRKGQKLPNVSPFQASIAANYKITDKLSVGADYKYYSKTNWDYSDGVKEYPKKAYSLVDANIAYEFSKNVSAVFEAKNIFGTKYDLNCSGGKCNVAPTNSYYLQLRAKF